MGQGTYALALAAGMVAALNPCGFALLPGYVSMVVVDTASGSRTASLGRALAMTAAMTGGFVTVFGLFGLVVTPLALSVERWLPWVTVAVGLGLVGLGIALLTGRELNLRLPKPGSARLGASAWSTGIYGASYAVASLSCTIGPFLAVTTSTFSSSSLVAGVGVFVTYAAGMGLVVGVVTVATALARDSLAGRLRRALPYVTRASGALVVVAGGYVAYYGWYEVRVLGGGDSTDPVVGTATRLQADLQRAVADAGAGTWAVVLAGLVAVALLAAAAASRRHPSTRGSRDSELTGPVAEPPPESGPVPR